MANKDDLPPSQTGFDETNEPTGVSDWVLDQRGSFVYYNYNKERWERKYGYPVAYKVALWCYVPMMSIKDDIC